MIPGNEPAFPEAYIVDDPAGVGLGILQSPGISMRALLAAMALQGILSRESKTIGTPYLHAEMAARSAVMHADALLLELERKPDSPI